MHDNLKETHSPATTPTTATATQLNRIIASMPASVKEHIHLAIEGVSHRMPCDRLPRERRARNRLLANASSLTLHDVPIWTFKSGEILADIEGCAATQPSPLIQLPISIHMIMDTPLSPRRGGEGKGCSDFVVDMSHRGYALSDVDMPVCIVSVIAKGDMYNVILVTYAGSLLLCAVSTDSHSLIARISLGYNVVMCCMLHDTIYFLSSGRLYAIDTTGLDNTYAMSTIQSHTPLQSQPQIRPRRISHGAKILTHISADCTALHALSSTGVVYSGTGNELVRSFSFEDNNIVSFIALSGKEIAYIILRTTMTAYFYTNQGDVLATYSAVLQLQQTINKQGAVLLLHGLILLVYKDAVYSIALEASSASSSRILSSNIVGSTLTVICSSGSKCFRLIAKIPTLSKSQLKQTSLRSYISIQYTEVRPVRFPIQSSSSASLLCFLTAYSLQSYSVYFLAFSETSIQTRVAETEHCIFGNKCSKPSLCSLCRCTHSKNALFSVPPDQSLMNLNWYTFALTEAGKLLDCNRAIQIIQLGINCDKIRAELMNVYTTSSLAPFLYPFMFNIAHLEVLVRAGCSFVASNLAIIIIQHFGASAPWLTALVCQNTNVSRRHLRDLASLFSLHLNFFGIPMLGIPARRAAVAKYLLNCETAEN